MNLESDVSIESLIQFLETGNQTQRSEAQRILPSFGEQAVLPLLEALHEASLPRPAASNLYQALYEGSSIRCAVAAILGNIGDVRTVPPLINILQNDVSEDARETAAGALGKIQDEAAIKPLVETAMFASYFGLRCSSLLALAHFKSTDVVQPVIHALQDTDKAVRDTAMLALIQLSQSGLDQHETERMDRIIHAYVSKLKGGDRNDRFKAAHLLGKIGGIQDFAYLVDSLNNDPSNEVKQAAAIALGSIGDVRALESLYAALASPNSSLKRSVSYALGQIGNQWSIDFLENLLIDPDPLVRAGAASAIKKIHSRSVVT